MPTTFRFLSRLAVLTLLGGAAIYALATFVEPSPEPVSIGIPTDRFE